MRLKEKYYYVFYKFYKLGDMSISIFPSDFIATIIITWLELIFLVSFRIYYQDFLNSNNYTDLYSMQNVVPVSIILLVNCYTFIINPKWKPYFKKFNSFSTEQNDKGTLIVAGIALFIVINFIISVSLR